MINNTRGAAFFAALNTGQGFKSYFREIFDAIGRVYVIKGGSGTGKSRFMREVEIAARSKGYSCEEILCSSDPTSLDGIIIKELDLAVIDGTAPHVHEPTLIGVREKFIDISAFLDSDKLAPHKKELISLMKEKSERYFSVYGYLGIISGLDEQVRNLAVKALEKDKMSKAVIRSISSVSKSGDFKKTVRIRSALGCKGRIVLNTYAKMAKTRYAINDLCGIGGIYLQMLLFEAEKRKIAVTVSYDPLYPDMPDAIYFPYSDTSFYIGSECDFEENAINVKRFVNDSVLKPYKPEIRAIRRLRSSVFDQLDYNFSVVNKLHTRIEEIYSSAMDWREKERFTKEFINLNIK